MNSCGIVFSLFYLLHSVILCSRSMHIVTDGKVSFFCVTACVCACVLKAQLLSHVQLCDPVDCSPPGSSVHGIIPARILQWLDVSSSRGSCHQGSNPCLLWVLHLQVVSLLLSHSRSLLTESVTQTHTHTCTCTFFIH